MKILIVQQLANENQARADAEKKAEERKVDSVSSKSAHFVGCVDWIRKCQDDNI